MRWLGILLVPMMVCACGDVGSSSSPTVPYPDLDGDGILSVFDACPTQAETVNEILNGDGCPDSPASFYAMVREDVEAYWDDVFVAVFSVYTPISLFAEYTTPVNTPCGISELRDAAYCPLNAGVYYDSSFMDDLLVQVGEVAPAFVVAHEISHHVGIAHLGWIPGVTLTVKASELAADCLAGSWLTLVAARGSLHQGADLLELADLATTMFAIGDPADAWFDPAIHGTHRERARAFGMGLLNGPVACVPQGAAPGPEWTMP